MKMRKQKRIGLSLIGISAALLMLVSTPGSTPEDCDATAVLLTLPLGVYMTVTQNYILFDSDPTEGDNQKGAFQNGKKKVVEIPALKSWEDVNDALRKIALEMKRFYERLEAEGRDTFKRKELLDVIYPVYYK